MRKSRKEKGASPVPPDGDGTMKNEESEEESSSEDEATEEEFEDELSEAEGSKHEEIASINDQINTKQRLIEQLELSNRRAMETRDQYEQQITILVTKIKHTEEERDNILSSFKPAAAATGKVKQVRPCKYKVRI